MIEVLNMRNEFKNLRSEILSEYRRNNAVADDDKLLIAIIWKNHGWDYNLGLYSNLRRVPSAESIRRTRQKLVADGLMKTSERATEKRYEAYKQYREEFECL